MSSCSYCGGEIPSRRKADSLYCSDKCRNAYNNSKKKRTSKLGDELPRNSSSFMEIYVPPPPPKPKYEMPNVTNRVINNIANNTLSGLPFGDVVIGSVNNTLKPDTDPIYTLVTVGLGALGAYCGYKFDDWSGRKKSKNRFRNTLIGGGLGVFAGQQLYSFHSQIKNDSYRRKTEALQHQLLQHKYMLELNQTSYNYSSEQVVLNGLQDYTESKIITGQEFVMLTPPSLNYQGKFKDFLGTSLDYNFQVLIYGSPGGGKSHLTAQFVSDFSNYGKVLVVMSEQGASKSGHAIYSRYGVDINNVNFLPVTSSVEVIRELEMNQYDFLFIDSINHLIDLSDNERISFIKRLKQYNLMGCFFVSHVTKTGDVKGSNQIKHDIDVEIEIENFIASNEKKNRFNPTIRKIPVFDDVKIEPTENKKYPEDSLVATANRILGNLESRRAI